MGILKHLRNLISANQTETSGQEGNTEGGPDMTLGSIYRPYIFDGDGQNWNDACNRRVFGNCPFELDSEDPRW